MMVPSLYAEVLREPTHMQYHSGKEECQPFNSSGIFYETKFVFDVI